MTLTRPCPDCHDGHHWKSRYGGNDPDTWDAGPCETCNGSQEVELWCEGWHRADRVPAVEWFQGMSLCAKCAATEKADALEYGEDTP